MSPFLSWIPAMAWKNTSMSAGPECAKLLEIKQERKCVRLIFFNMKNIVCQRIQEGA